MPEITFKTLDEVPEDLRGDAKTVDGAFVVNVVSSKKLSEFRDNNVKAMKERDEWKGRFEKIAPVIGDDVDKFLQEIPELRKTAQLVADGKLKGSDAIEAAIQARIANVQETFKATEKDLQNKITAHSTAEAQWKGRYERAVLDQQITNAVIAQDSVANPSALPDILARAAQMFTVQENGTVIAKRDGEVVYGGDGVTPMTPKEWLTKLVAEAPYLGKSSAGGGAHGGNGGAAASYGMSEADFAKLPPQERIRLARQAAKKS